MDFLNLLNEPWFPFGAALVLGALGALMYRWRGMNGNDVPALFKPRIVRRLACCTLIAIALFSATLSLWSFLAIPLAFFGIIVGHGSYFPRGKDGEPNIDNEVFASITHLISKPMNETARFVGMALTGLVTTLPILMIPVVAHGHSGTVVVIAMWFGLVGILKAVAYWLSPDTEVAEWAWGFILTSSAALVGFDLGLWHLIF